MTDHFVDELGPLDTRIWRVGEHYGIHVYAEDASGQDVPIATAMTRGSAAQIVMEHNAKLQESDGTR